MNLRIADLLIEHGYKIYIATRVYDYSQKLQAEEIENTVHNALLDVIASY